MPNREVITLVWYDPRCTEASVPDIGKLCRLNNYILYHTDESMCVDFLTSKMNRHEHIVVVLDHGVKILDQALKCEQVRAVLLVDSSGASPLDTIEVTPSKPVAVFDQSDSMLVTLQQVLVDVEHQVAHQLDSMFTRFDLVRVETGGTILNVEPLLHDDIEAFNNNETIDGHVRTSLLLLLLRRRIEERIF